ncbi:hypothetical protein Arnit_1004 [Arcobacter nitrofigilis DSM 7299]|uniref:Restriction endonuclease type IV Mrr domain-containing protein n=1 Tax=Arcobacter nitrofigilis (strain ATCC 33309 / DSM 7299 / CCUG 15893 / LMG 7604 / NCTC 12251 / CI) TaxID=572480 RepID=D5V385_ARCNC|nr:restriction endonuclease [Arcobacter nitrofigilis]ADG92667.1 hypothetical protein Arnit_1004 [Arcobacter nitrofigilis DSM 7299]
MSKKYYLVKQSFPYLDTKINKIYCPCNISHLKKLISFMTGTIEVYLYDEENNKREDLTIELGNRDFNPYEHRFEKLYIVKINYLHKHVIPEYINFYTIKNVRSDFLPSFFMNDYVYNAKNGIEIIFDESLLSCNIEEYKRKMKYGKEYEEFISNKYIESGYQVELRGIKNSFNDGGLDIIAKKDTNIVLVQCKNWKMSNNYKINQKDLRAFVGDCFLYLKDIESKDLKVSYHFIVSHDNILTKSAEIFLEQNKFIKFKCVPFEENNLD